MYIGCFFEPSTIESTFWCLPESEFSLKILRVTFTSTKNSSSTICIILQEEDMEVCHLLGKIVSWKRALDSHFSFWFFPSWKGRVFARQCQSKVQFRIVARGRYTGFTVIWERGGALNLLHRRQIAAGNYRPCHRMFGTARREDVLYCDQNKPLEGFRACMHDPNYHVRHSYVRHCAALCTSHFVPPEFTFIRLLALS